MSDANDNSLFNQQPDPAPEQSVTPRDPVDTEPRSEVAPGQAADSTATSAQQVSATNDPLAYSSTESHATAPPSPMEEPITAAASDTPPIHGFLAAAPILLASTDAIRNTPTTASPEADNQAPADSQPASPRGAFARFLSGNRFRTPTDSARRVLIAGRITLGIITVALLGLLGRVAQLQTTPPKPIAGLIDSQKSKFELSGRRGTLRDRHGRPLAISRPAKRVFLDPTQAEDLSTFPESVGYALDYDPMWVTKRLAGRIDSRYIVLDRRLSDERADKIKDVKIKGLGVETHLVRDYPQGTLAAQLIGFVNKDGKGLEGVERIFDADLRGKPGSLGFFRDAQRRPLWIESNSYTPPADGKAVRLSIDLVIQSIAETELAKACKEFQAQSGEVVVMDPYTGETLAIASYPFLDANEYGNTPPDKRRIRAITDTYEPGSTFKPFVWASALEQGFFRPNEMFDCTTSGVYQFPSGRRLRDAHPNGLLNGDGVLIKSSNIGMGKIGERMGREKLHKAVKSFGFGDSTRVGLPGEVRGRVWPLRMWSGYSITSISMGQEVAVTPMQMARAFSVFANGGLLVSPSIRAHDDKPEGQSTPVYQRVIKPATAAHTRQVLRQVVTEGTGRRADSPLYAIFGKTGTAQIAAKNGKGYIPDAYVGSFICGAPLDNPRLVVICVIHRPNRAKGYYGGIVAAPAARAIVEQSLIYMGVQPDPVEPKNGKIAMRIND